MIEARLVYLAGPIYGQDDTCISWRNDCAKDLQRKNIMSLNPTDADYRGRETTAGIPKRIVESDKKSIMYCDTLLAKCDHPSFGTAMEVHFAWSLRKQVIVVTKSYSPWIRYHADHVFSTVEEAVKNLQMPELNPGISK